MLIAQQVKHLEAEFRAAKLPTNPAVDWSDDAYNRPYQKREVTPPPPPSPPPDADLVPDAESLLQASLMGSKFTTGETSQRLLTADSVPEILTADIISSNANSFPTGILLLPVQTVAPAPAPAPAPSPLEQRTWARKQLPPWDIAANGQEVSKSASLTPCTPSTYPSLVCVPVWVLIGCTCRCQHGPQPAGCRLRR